MSDHDPLHQLRHTEADSATQLSERDTDAVDGIRPQKRRAKWAFKPQFEMAAKKRTVSAKLREEDEGDGWF